MTNKYYEVRKKYLAEALSYLGMPYMKFNKEDGTIVYSFENTDNFNLALNELTKLKNRLAQ
ncbi:hypothetical protein K2F43_05990 [Clostridium estertheticum]|uniref:hypothetical protein n=1 Tax=Clostridium estertheticum TaxID=238834 RepID=UPI001C6E780E|nr:hypothetical protein [Clostridium estertheticum]MBW9170756.1 hypothetical protein [Clostridium estertheticum]WLC74404.1 hypothetical protein KTC99_16760 [Clostridium estertheticum]